ncbi:hypothetical protein [Amnibacterium kyonggiense]|uniref:Uncharacterized protein n=1 Tax=Amnibacterium kyonggiense TaxID=595671 RepID=A0A4R7FHJ6_9MICO|nr:hypothetical protein [Amnibacterium kyonggiense]TDS74509.1 hypothetical protein CLV52_3692 [Amnibacterium kyonggiense]
MPEPRLSKPESNPVYLWIERHPWKVGLITVGLIVCFAFTVAGMAYLLGTGNLSPQSSTSATP